MKKTIQCSSLFALLFVTAFDCLAQNSAVDKPTAGLSDEPKETAFNTASQTFEGKTYKLVLIGDCLPKLFIDGEKVGKNELSFYEENIETLREIINDRQKQEWKRLSAMKERLNDQMITDIVNKKLVNSRGDISSYYLTSERLTVNGKLQDPDTFHYFRDKYVKSDDTVLYFDRETASASNKQ